VIGLFKQKSPANIVLLFIFGLLLKLPLFLYPKAITTGPNDGRLYQFLVGYLQGGSVIVCSLISFLFLYVQALLVNYLINEYRMTTRQTFLPGMAYLMITSFLPEWNFLSASLLTSTLIIWAFIKLFRLYNVDNASASIFNIGLIIGISSFLFFPSVFFGICILLGLLILRPFRLNELFLFLLGVVTPYYFYAVYLYLTNAFSVKKFVPVIGLQVHEINATVWLAASTFLLIIPFLIGGYFIQTHLRKMLIQVRKNWSILLLYLLVALFIPFINNSNSFHNWVLLAAPFAAFHTPAYLYPPRKWLPLAIFAITIGFIVAQQYFTTAWH